MITAPEPLHSGHDCSAFDCGKPALNDWLTHHALANQAKGFTRVIVACEGNRVLGFYGLAPIARRQARLRASWTRYGRA